MHQRIELHQTRYASHHYDEKLDTLFSNWFSETSEMDNDDFKFEMNRWMEVSRKCQPTKIYDYCVNFVYPINPAQQTWMANLLNPGWVNLGVKQYSHVVPEEYISNLSVYQMFQEFLAMKLENQFKIEHFSDELEAIHWLGFSEVHLPKRFTS